MALWTAKEIEQRAQEAEQARSVIDREIQECMALAMPWRGKRSRRGAFDNLFDGTAPTAVHRFASRFSRDLTPAFQRWFQLLAGPMVPDAMKETVNRALEPIAHAVHAVLDASAFGKASNEMYADLAIGTGALLVTEGDDKTIVNFQCAPPWALGIEEGGGGRIDNVYWCKDFPAWTLTQVWPAAEWGPKVRELIAERSTKPVKVQQASYCYFDPSRQITSWWIAILSKVEGENAIVWESERRTNPWIIPRWWTTAGDPWGRGPLMLSLPDIKTANKTVEMVLRAAAYSLAPPLMVLHDGVVNPDQMRLAPNALIRVARTGGPMGPSIEPMNIGSKVDLAQIVLQDLRQGIKKNLLDDQLPPTNGAVRSASEIVERAKDLQFDAGAAFQRMNHEYVPAVIASVIDILDKKKVAAINWSQLKIDQLVLMVNVISPMARSQSLDDVQNTVQWLETLKAIGGDPMVAHAAKVEDVGVYLGEQMGVTYRVIRTKTERDALAQAAAQAIAQQAQQPPPAKGGKEPPPPALPPPAAPPGPGIGGGARPAPFQTAPATLNLPALTPGAP